jgi:hypothetical protein
VLAPAAGEALHASEENYSRAGGAGYMGACADLELLSKLHFALKNRICEEAKPSEIDAPFDFEAVEQSSALQAYNDILPFGDTFRVNVGDTEYLVLDQYCVRPGCRCTQTHLNLVPIKDGGRTDGSTRAVIVDYDAVSWDPIASEPLPCDVAEFRQISEASQEAG